MMKLNIEITKEKYRDSKDVCTYNYNLLVIRDENVHNVHNNQ